MCASKKPGAMYWPFASTTTVVLPMQWEASPMYHNEVLMCMQEAIRISRIFGDDLFDENELDLIKRMGRVDMILKNPEHKQPMVGDSDDTDLRDMITQTAFLFMDGNSCQI